MFRGYFSIFAAVAVSVVFGAVLKAAEAQTVSQTAQVSVSIHYAPKQTTSYSVVGANGMTVETAAKLTGVAYLAVWEPASAQTPGGYIAVGFDGITSGEKNWLYCVNGVLVSASMSQKTLQNADKVDWYFTTTNTCSL